MTSLLFFHEGGQHFHVAGKALHLRIDDHFVQCAGAVAGRWCFDWLSHMDITAAMPRFEVPVEYR